MQGLANKWIRNMEKESGLLVVKLTDANYLRTLENAIQFGKPVLMENVMETLDASLEPLLQKQTFKQGGECWGVGGTRFEEGGGDEIGGEVGRVSHVQVDSGWDVSGAMPDVFASPRPLNAFPPPQSPLFPSLQGALCIKLGDATVEYSDDFKFYITTKLRNPHYAPELCTKVRSGHTPKGAGLAAGTAY